MKLMVFVFVLLWASILGEKVGKCIGNYKTCGDRSVCCSGCCLDHQCVPYSIGCNKDKNPCDSIVCPANKVCYLQQVMCIRAPCPPIPVCMPIDSGNN